MRPRLTYLADANLGGIYEYARYQAAALAEIGLQVSFLCREDYPGEPVRGCRMERRLPVKGEGGTRWLRVWRAIRSERAAARAVWRLWSEGRGAQVLGACYREYFSPLWAGAFRRAQAAGLRFATVAHDPVRDFVVGPLWWHHWSVAQAYSFVTQVFTHDETPLDTGGRPCRAGVAVIPHGPYELPRPRAGREQLRSQLGLSPEDAVFLAFGHLRDAKNLDLFLRALPRLPERVRLVVAGKESSTSQRPASHYRALADELGVAARCRWHNQYLSAAEAADLFAVADFCLLTYNRQFRSASGVLNTAIGYQRPVLASSGTGPLASVVRRYGLGVWVEPDSMEAILEGAVALLAGRFYPQWGRYVEENSWARNADLVQATLFRQREVARDESPRPPSSAGLAEGK